MFDKPTSHTWQVLKEQLANFPPIWGLPKGSKLTCVWCAPIVYSTGARKWAWAWTHNFLLPSPALCWSDYICPIKFRGTSSGGRIVAGTSTVEDSSIFGSHVGRRSSKLFLSNHYPFWPTSILTQPLLWNKSNRTGWNKQDWRNTIPLPKSSKEWWLPSQGYRSANVKKKHIENFPSTKDIDNAIR